MSGIDRRALLRAIAGGALLATLPAPVEAATTEPAAALPPLPEIESEGGLEQTRFRIWRKRRRRRRRRVCWVNRRRRLVCRR